MEARVPRGRSFLGGVCCESTAPYTHGKKAKVNLEARQRVEVCVCETSPSSRSFLGLALLDHFHSLGEASSARSPSSSRPSSRRDRCRGRSCGRPTGRRARRTRRAGAARGTRGSGGRGRCSKTRSAGHRSSLALCRLRAARDLAWKQPEPGRDVSSRAREVVLAVQQRRAAQETGAGAKQASRRQERGNPGGWPQPLTH